MDLFEKYRALNLDGSLIALAYAEMEQPYFCYPQNAKTIGFEGCILYCFLPEYPGMVFAANPESCADTYVYPLAASFADFMRLILACGSANPVEQIAWMDQAQFEQHLKSAFILFGARARAYPHGASLRICKSVAGGF